MSRERVGEESRTVDLTQCICMDVMRRRTIRFSGLLRFRNFSGRSANPPAQITARCLANIVREALLNDLTLAPSISAREKNSLEFVLCRLLAASCGFEIMK
jgi:hypothetical protein